MIKVHFNKGRKRTTEQRLRIAEATKKAMHDSGAGRIISAKNKGKTPWNKGLKMDKAFCDKVSKAKQGHKPWNTGRTMTLKQRTVLSYAHGGDGSFTCLYPDEFDKALKRFIWERDSFRCQICGYARGLICHHIDEIKENCVPDNLVTLCRSCHTRLHHNSRYYGPRILEKFLPNKFYYWKAIGY